MKLYALLDRTLLDRKGWTIERFVERAERLGAELLQYRDKEGDVSRVARALEVIGPRFAGRLIVNDHPELADLCDGVHLGQEDLARYGRTPEAAVAAVRQIVGEKRWIGLSTHNEAEIERANDLAIDYIGLGACRGTATKKEAHVLGCEAVARLAALSRHPVAAIGGVRLDDEIPHVTWGVVGSALFV